MQIKTLNINQKGFTVIELLVAMSAFTAMVLIASMTTLQIGKMYYKGVYTIRTQENTRVALASVTEAVQFGSGAITNPPTSKNFQSDANSPIVTVKAVCVGSVRFSYVIDSMLVSKISDQVVQGQDNTSQHVLWQDNGGDNNCEPQNLLVSEPTASGRELLGEKMRLSAFSVAPSPTGLTNIQIGVIYGDRDLIEYQAGLPVKCLGSFVGAQWCASSNLNTQVLQRLTGAGQ